MEDVVYFEINNWWPKEDYPDEEPFLSWMSDDLNIPFENDEWAKENELCVNYFLVDMSTAFCVSASKKWVKDNCPCLLDWPKFLREPDEDGEIESYFGGDFREYIPENFGAKLIYSY